MLHPLGFGVGLRPAHYPDFHARKTPQIDWLEVISENFMGVGGRPRRHLEKIRADYPVATHGIGLNIAGLDPINERYLKLLSELIHWLEPSMVTDHLCWTSWKQQNSFDLLPFPYNEETLNHVCSRIQKVQDILRRPMLLENPSAYIDFLSSDMHEPDFLNEVCARTGCGILLDLNNCMVNSKNLGWDPVDYINRVNPAFVGQFHLAGHAAGEEISIDTHDQPVPPEVWTLYQAAVRLFPDVPTLVEWDGQLPSLDRLGQELDSARIHAAAAPPREREAVRVPDLRSDVQVDLSTHQHALFHILRRNEADAAMEPLLRPTRVKPEFGLNAYKNNHFMGLLEALKSTFTTLHGIVEDDGMADIVARYTQEMPPEHFSINNAGDRLPTFLMERDLGIDFGVPQAIIAELAAFDATRTEITLQPDSPVPAFALNELMDWTPDQWDSGIFVLRNEYKLLHLNWNILSVYQALEAGEDPAPPEPATAPVLMTRAADGHIYELCPESIQTLLTLPRESFALVDLVELFRTPSHTDEQATELALDALIAAIKRSMIGQLPS